MATGINGLESKISRSAIRLIAMNLPRSSSISAGENSGRSDVMNLAETNHILRLSDSQLAIVRQAAVPLSPAARGRYLKVVAAKLAETERVDDATVKAVLADLGA